MKKSKKAALEIISQLVESREQAETHMNRVGIAQKKFHESLVQLKWVLETTVPHFPAAEYKAAFRDIEVYKECLINLSEAESVMAQDFVTELNLYKKLIEIIPDSLWKKA